MRYNYKLLFILFIIFIPEICEKEDVNDIVIDAIGFYDSKV